ncbi:uncharacterized protein LOC113870168 [Abrus precatorius]|uniref:Uncharacterized protein LOC113870168 n=1 Tax=Abrus precatorius TaxID=3816 RepID=A0A8B8M1M9_ABRPR|nr:uncharacterized protein LOC113870168 [Abrus precatorius]
MGNCMETYTVSPRQQDIWEEQQKEESGTCNGFAKIDDNEGKNGLRMKIVLTKEELKWLILQLNEKGGMGVEQVLKGIERSREKVEVEGWKPSLESILEAPETLEMDRSFS